jgi:hypothetical protein
MKLYAGRYHLDDCDFPEIDQAVCSCPKNLKPETPASPSDRQIFLDFVEKKMEEFDKKFTRIGKGEDFGKFRDDWFVEDGIKSKDIKTFIRNALTELDENLFYKYDEEIEKLKSPSENKTLESYYCGCACHEDKLNKPYLHDKKCCDLMNGYVEKSSEETEVYLSGETVRFLLERFKENGAIGLIDIKVKAFIPSEKPSEELGWEELEKFLRQRCVSVGNEEEKDFEKLIFDDETYMIGKKDLMSFIRQEISKATEEERERIKRKLLDSNKYETENMEEIVERIFN